MECQICTTKVKIRRNKYAIILCFSSHLDGVRCVVFHPVESMVITGSEDRTLKLWNLDKSAVLRK
jgi:WD40 repeat protein